MDNDKTFIKIPVLKTVQLPGEKGGPDQIAIFHAKKEYFLVTLEQAEFFNQFIFVETEVVPVVPAREERAKQESAAQRRARLLAEAEAELNEEQGPAFDVVDEPHYREDETDEVDLRAPDAPRQPKPVEDDPLFAELASIGIERNKKNPHDAIMRIGDAAGPDGNSLNDRQLKLLVQSIVNENNDRDVRVQCFEKLCNIPVSILNRTASFTPEYLRKHVVNTRSAALTLDERSATIPQDLLPYLTGQVGKTVIMDENNEPMVLGKSIDQTFKIPTSDTRGGDDVKEKANPHIDTERVQMQLTFLNRPAASTRQLEQGAAARNPVRSVSLIPNKP